MSYWSAPRKLAVAKAFTALQSRAVRKIPRLHRLAALQLDGADAQNGCVAAAHQQFILLAEQYSRCRVAAARQPGTCSFRRRFAPNVASLPAKRGVSPRPRRESPHPVVNLPRRPPPIDPPVLFLEHWRVAGCTVVLRFRSNGSGGQPAQ